MVYALLYFLDLMKEINDNGMKNDQENLLPLVTQANLSVKPAKFHSPAEHTLASKELDSKIPNLKPE